MMRKGYLCCGTIVALVLCTAVAGRTEESADQGKMEELREMFASPYQEEDYFRTDRLLLTASGSLKPVRLAPSVASVITKEDIEEIGATTLDEALESVPGLHVFAGGAFFPGYSIRGIHTYLNPQTLVMVNGLPITSPYNGRRIAGLRMPVADISRVEVVRGPGSAVYGADAFSGVINVITKDGQEIDGVTSGVRAGSFGSVYGWGQYGGNLHGWDVSLSLEYQEGDGDKERRIGADFQSTLDGGLNALFQQPPASLAPGKLPTQYRNLDAHVSLRKEQWTFRLWGSLGDDIGNGPGALFSLDPQGYIDYDLFLADLLYERENLLADLDLRLRLSYLYQYSDVRYHLLPPGTVLPLDSAGNLTFSPNPADTSYFALFSEGYIGEPIQTDRIPAFDLESFYQGFTSHQLRLGAGFRNQSEDTETYTNFGSEALNLAALAPPLGLNVIGGHLTYADDSPSIYLPDGRRDIWYLSLQDEWTLAPAWVLTAGVRYDHYSDVGGTVNPRMALVWETRYDLTSKLLYGRAFRPPSFAESYNQNNPAILGNPNLDPETIDTVELAFDYQPSDRLRTNVSFFYYEGKDLIDYVVDAGGSTSTAQNAKDQQGHGGEVEAEWNLTDALRMLGNVAYQRSEDQNTNAPVADAPELQLYLNAHYRFADNWSVDGQYFWIGNRHRAAGDPRADIKDNDWVNLTLRRKNIGKHWEVAVALRNLFAENLLEPSNGLIPEDYPLEGRSVYGEIRARF